MTRLLRFVAPSSSLVQVLQQQSLTRPASTCSPTWCRNRRPAFQLLNRNGGGGDHLARLLSAATAVSRAPSASADVTDSSDSVQSRLDMSSSPKRVCIVGSGNWGSAISMLVGANAKSNPGQFAEEVRMWVFEEEVDGQKLSEIINTKHENVKYLKGKKLPENVKAVPDVVEAASDADILIFVIPHQFIARALAPLKGKVKEGAIGISLIKGFDILPTGGIKLLSDTIHDILGIPMSVLMGANLAPGVANGDFCETTIGCKDAEKGAILKKLFQTPNFRVVVVKDTATVEVCGALKNVVACGAGFADGLKFGDNTKAAVIRLGLMEMIKFTHAFYHDSHPQLATFFESCGVADLVTTCYGGRNRRVSEAFVTTGKSIDSLEKELLGGQKLQGPETAAEVNTMLKAKKMEEDFPLFTAVHRVCTGEIKAEDFMDSLRQHPEHMVDVKEEL